MNCFKLNYFYKGASSLEALRTLSESGFHQRSSHRLHAKIYIFDEKALITSANLTFGGLSANKEYGIIIDGELAKEITKDFSIFFNDENNSIINNEIIDEADKIIKATPKIELPVFTIKEKDLFEKTYNNIKEIDDVFDGSIDSILSTLTSWKKDVFQCLLEVNEDIFSLKEVYQFEDLLKEKHPDNYYIKPKIRQQLQYLRDIGLIQFVNPGTYRKLWKYKII